MSDYEQRSIALPRSNLQSMVEICKSIKGGEGEEEPYRCPPRDSDIAIGRVVVLHGLTSGTGKLLNGHLALVCKQDGDRWGCKVLHASNRNKTVSIKAANLRVEEPEPGMHPPYMPMLTYKMSRFGMTVTPQQEMEETRGKFRNGRGICYDDEPILHRARKLVQLLDYPEEDYMPNETVMLGVADLFYGGVQHLEPMFKHTTMYDLEHFAGIYSLASLCQGEIIQPLAVGCGDGKDATECVLFALLEAAPRSIEVVLSLIVMTPYVGAEEDCEDSSRFRRDRKNPFLTPAQTNEAYCLVVRGPIFLLLELLLNSPNVAGEAFLQLLQTRYATLFRLTLKRLFSLVARESMGTADGKSLGKYARGVLALISWDLDVSYFCYLFHSGSIEFAPGAVMRLLREDDITTYEQLSTFFESLIDTDAAKAFHDQWREQNNDSGEHVD